MKFNKLIPEMMVSDINRSLSFYRDVLGFKVEYTRWESKFALLSFQGSQLMIQQNNNSWSTGKLEYPFGRGINIQIEVKAVKKLIEKIKSSHIQLFEELKDNVYRVGKDLNGNREFLIQDPDGYLLRFFQDLGKKKIK